MSCRPGIEPSTATPTDEVSADRPLAPDCPDIAPGAGYSTIWWPHKSVDSARAGPKWSDPFSSALRMCRLPTRHRGMGPPAYIPGPSLQAGACHPGSSSTGCPSSIRPEIVWSWSSSSGTSWFSNLPSSMAVHPSKSTPCGVSELREGLPNRDRHG